MERYEEYMGTFLGFDYGTHKIGVAVGQIVTKSANPLVTLSNVKNKPDWEKIEILIMEWKPQALIIGHPYEMTDKEASNAKNAKRFSRQLYERFHLPVHLVDERLTTRDAWVQLGKDAIKDQTKVDSFAAKLILETWLQSN
tara:strand:+ start:340 stop:762 length:423 start_codon:yes stop_codon:yes gene_type:complete